MSITREFMNLVDAARRAIGKSGRVSVCSAGYPDLLLSANDANDFLGDAAIGMTYRPDSEKILRWHGFSGKLPGVYDATEFFERMGCILSVIDFEKVRGGELVADLNYPLPMEWHGKFDIVIDSGTCEHVFHAGQALLNLANLVCAGGFIVQGLPLSSFNHGFYNMNPTLVVDLYSELNGYEINYFKGWSNATVQLQEFDLPPHQRFRDAPSGAVMVVVARRKSVVDIKPFIQRKYTKQMLRKE